MKFYVNEIKEELKNNKRVEAVLRENPIVLNIMSMESFNFPSVTESYSQESEEKEGPPWDVEGSSGTDVYAEWKLRWWHPQDWVDIFRSLSECIEFGFKTNPLKVEGWVWVVDSLEIAKSDMAEKLAAQKVDYYTDGRIDRDKFKSYSEEIDKILPTITKDQLIVFIEETCTRISKEIWVQNNDPTCFIVDNDLVPYDLRDGWSHAMVRKLVKKWLEALGYYNKVYLKKET